MLTYLKRIAIVAFAAFSLVGLLASAETSLDQGFKDARHLLIYPMPRHLELGTGTYVISNGTLAVAPGLSRRVVAKITDIFRASSGISLTEGKTSPCVTFTPDPALHDQGYSLTIDAAGIHVGYKDDAGAFHATATLKQILVQQRTTLTFLRITDDYPDFPNRGFMWDISRNKIPTVATVKRVVDYMADLKYNQLQLYIEGYPFAYDSYPDVWKYGTPLTPADFKEIDAYCTARFIAFVPNQNSYGHMSNWLRLPQFRGLSEKPGKPGQSTVALTNPDTLTFLNNLYNDLLPNFTSEYFNIGGDEIGEIGQSKVAFPALTKEEIYLEGLKTIHGLVTTRNKKMMFWADMVVHYADSNPTIVQAAKTSLPNAVALDWGYEFDHNFGGSTAKIKKSGIPYYVCPGTATWRSFVGRTSNMTENLEKAAHWGRQNGAIGFLLTVWGDQGHLQHVVCDYPPLAYSAGLSWCQDTNRKEIVDYNAYVSRFIFKDKAETLAAKLSNLADYGAISPRCWNKSWINAVGTERPTSNRSLLDFIKFQKGATQEIKQAQALSQAEQVSLLAKDFLDYLGGVTITADDAALVRAELKNGAQILKAAADYSAMRLRIHSGKSTLAEEKTKARDLSKEYLPAIGEFRDIWLKRNTYSDLDETLGYLYSPLIYFKNIAGDSPSPLPDGNHVLLTPDRLPYPISPESFVNGWVWSTYGSGEPVISYAMGTYSVGGAIREGIFSLLKGVPGCAGQVFVYDPVIAIQKDFCSRYEGDPTGRTKLLPKCGWPLIFGSDTTYTVTFKAKFKNGAAVESNLALSMPGAKPDGNLKDLPVPVANRIYSRPDANGWVTIQQTVEVTDNIRTASLSIIPSSTVTDTLYLAELYMAAPSAGTK
jgi:hypothetical protein